MATELPSSEAALPGHVNLAGQPTSGAGTGERFWLDGEVVFCACPDCLSPMSIRMWLRLADCMRCETSIEINDEDLQEIARLKSRSAKTDEPVSAPPPPAPELQPASPPPDPPPPDPPAGPSVKSTYSRRRQVAATQPIGVRRKIREMATLGSVQVWWQDFFRDWPAWMISGILHLAVLLILSMLASGLIFLEEEPFITLSVHVDRPIQEGGHTFSLPTDEVKFDLPIDPNDLPETQDARIRLAQDARDLRLDPDAPLPNAVSTVEVKEAIRSEDPNHRALAVRDPRVRAEMVRQEGGTTLTEAAVARGLRWMASHQSGNGSWSLHQFHQAGDCKGRCQGAGSQRSDSAGTSLVLLPFLGAGQTHLVGKYQREVAAGLKYLLSIQKPNGDLRGNSHGHVGMYAHGQAAIVLCEAYKMTGDVTLREPAQLAVDFLVDAQYVSGGWRYYPAKQKPNEVPDTSVLGWQVTALHSAKGAYLDVPDSAMQLASFYLDKAQATTKVKENDQQIIYGRDGGLYAYQPGQPFKRSMTAEGLLCRMFMGWRLDHPGIQEGIGFIVNHQLPQASNRDLYYWYYGTQMMHHVGGEPWDKWNARIRDVLVELQETKGHQAGSWPTNSGQHGAAGGRVYTTAFATAILEVYYRHAPLFRQIDLE